MANPPDTVELARERIRQAMEHVQNAQTELGKAQELLSSVVGVMPRWTALSKLYGQVRREWYRREAFARGKGRVDLDGIAKQNLERDAQGGRRHG